MPRDAKPRKGPRAAKKAVLRPSPEGRKPLRKGVAKARPVRKDVVKVKPARAAEEKARPREERGPAETRPSREERRAPRPAHGPGVREAALAAARLALEKKAEDVKILDLSGFANVCDFFVVASGHSETQVRAIADAVEEGLSQQGVRVWHREGYAGRRWILLDFVDIVVHVFHRETREFYMLERLWGDAPVESVDE